MCKHCEAGIPWDDDWCLSFLTRDRNGWHISVEEKDTRHGDYDNLISPSIDFCPKCGKKLPREGRGF